MQYARLSMMSLVSVIDGIGLQLLRADRAPQLENAYAAAWLGILSLEV